jgi:hypothetical protein
MYINKTCCLICNGTGKTQKWIASEPDADGTRTIKMEDAICDTCKGKGYTEYPVFTVVEAKVIAEHFGFIVIGDSSND